MRFKDTNYFFGRAMDVMDVGRGIEELLVTPNRSVSVKVPLEMEYGQVRVFQGYQVQHNKRQVPSPPKILQTGATSCPASNVRSPRSSSRTLGRWSKTREKIDQLGVVAPTGKGRVVL